jgi:hypothetical protein
MSEKTRTEKIYYPMKFLGLENRISKSGGKYNVAVFERVPNDVFSFYVSLDVKDELGLIKENENCVLTLDLKTNKGFPKLDLVGIEPLEETA